AAEGGLSFDEKKKIYCSAWLDRAAGASAGLTGDNDRAAAGTSATGNRASSSGASAAGNRASSSGASAAGDRASSSGASAASLCVKCRRGNHQCRKNEC
ncbi:MAG: hypothetical protein J6Y92_03535, partial [Lentisphaeria bacterium]|nr:hypothetical protein [Lentisphaeria bacterium]